MKIKFVSVGKTSFDYLKDGCEIYQKRLKHYCKVNWIELPYPKLGKSADQKTVKQAEGKMILNEVGNSDFLILLDENGKSFSSTEFSVYLQKRMNSGANLVVVIGGAYGFSEDVYKRANDKLSLSRMTFSHQMVRLFALEQVYRAFTILKGEPYHHN